MPIIHGQEGGVKWKTKTLTNLTSWAREWAVAVVNNHNDRMALELYNNQIRLARDDRGVRMMEGIEALADLLGVGLSRPQGISNRGYFVYHDVIFYQYFDPRQEGAEKEDNGIWKP